MHKYLVLILAYTLSGINVMAQCEDRYDQRVFTVADSLDRKSVV